SDPLAQARDSRSSENLTVSTALNCHFSPRRDNSRSGENPPEYKVVHYGCVLSNIKTPVTQVSYNTRKDKWSVNEHIYCHVQEKKRLHRDKTRSSHLTTISHNK
ncbi:hypothetical protein Lal_00042668, partial [Lupinus albus]